MGAVQSSSNGNEYCSSKGLNEIQKCLALALEYKQIKLLKNIIKGFSLDEGETIDKNKILSVNAYIVDDNLDKKVMLVGINELAKFDAETISSETLKILKSRHFENDLVVGGATDGASVMLGKNSGVLKRLKDFF